MVIAVVVVVAADFVVVVVAAAVVVVVVVAAAVGPDLGHPVRYSMDPHLAYPVLGLAASVDLAALDLQLCRLDFFGPFVLAAGKQGSHFVYNCAND